MEISKWRKMKKKPVICETAGWAPSQKRIPLQIRFQPSDMALWTKLRCRKTKWLLSVPSQERECKSTGCRFPTPMQNFLSEINFFSFWPRNLHFLVVGNVGFLETKEIVQYVTSSMLDMELAVTDFLSSFSFSFLCL